jgi:DNA-binding transcriptional ArsR family regulator
MIGPTSGGRAVERKRDEAPLDRVLRVLNHPVRRGILRELVEGPGSATTLSRQLGEDLGLVSYHLNQVLAKDCEIVELVDSIPRRGAIEKVYRLKFDGLGEDDREAGKGRTGNRRGRSFEESFIIDVIAMDSPAFKDLEGSS